VVFVVTGVLALIRVAYYVAWAAVGYATWKRTQGLPLSRAMGILVVIMIGVGGAAMVHTITAEIGRAIVQRFFPEYIID
jgi:hypothetical protein